MNPLRQSTASQSRMVGPFVDNVDFITLETGLTIANTDVELMKNGAASVNKNSGGGTHRANGNYALTWDATDTNTIGELKVSIAIAGALVVERTYTVLAAVVYDALYGTSPTLLTAKDIGQLYESTIGTVNSQDQPSFDMDVAIVSDDNWIGQLCTVEDVGTGETVVRWIADVDQVNDRLILDDNGPLPFTVAVTDIIRIESRVHPMYALQTFAPPTRTELTADTDSILARMRGYIRTFARNDAAIAIDQAAEIIEINADDGNGAGAYDNTEDSLEALSGVLNATGVLIAPAGITAIQDMVVEPTGNLTLGDALNVALTMGAGEWDLTGGIATFKDPTGAVTRVTAQLGANSRTNVVLNSP